MNKKIKTEIALGIILILTVVIGWIVWMSGRNQVNPKPQTAQLQEMQTTQRNMQTKKINDQVDEWQTYQNDEIGVEFKYPAKISKIVERESKDGKAIWINIDFTRENANEVTNDFFKFSAYAIDYIPSVPIFSFETGKDWSANSACPNSLIYSEGNACKIIDIAGEKAVWKNLITPSYEGLPLAITEISFNNKSTSIFKRLQFSLGYREIEDELNSIWDGNLSNEKSYKTAELKAKEYSKNIMERRNLPGTISENIKLVDQILSTFKFTK